MKFLNKVIVFVMGVVVIGVVATTIGVVTQTKNVGKSVTFELLENDELEFNVHNKFNEYVILDEGIVRNLVNVKVNNTDYPNWYLFYSATTDSYNITESYIGSNNDVKITSEGYSIVSGFNVGDTITVTFAVEVATPVIIKTLLLLTPLILSASLIGYLSLSVKKGDE